MKKASFFLILLLICITVVADIKAAEEVKDTALIIDSTAKRNNFLVALCKKDNKLNTSSWKTTTEN